MLKISTYPNKILQAKTKKVTYLSKEIFDLIEKMRVTIHIYHGVGLSANQIGKQISLAIIEYKDDENPLNSIPFFTLINPKIFKKEDPVIIKEGCLSLPGKEYKVIRYKKIKYYNYDENLSRRRHSAEGYLAQVIQHEIDHLNGKLINSHKIMI